MGTIGFEITQSDLVKDVIGDYKSSLKTTQDIQMTSKFVIDKYTLTLDEDELPLLNLAIASCEWKYGRLSEQAYARVIEDFKNKNGFEIWQEQGEKVLSKRIEALQDFINKISLPNPKPSKLPKLIIRPPRFKEGDCLSIQLDDGSFGLALVIKSDHSDLEYGANLIIKLNYCKKKLPDVKKINKIKPYKLSKKEIAKKDSRFKNYHIKQGYLDYEYKMGWLCRLSFKSMKDRIHVIANIDVSKYNDFKSNSYITWDYLAKW